MSTARAASPRLLFAVSNDYGELSNALYLLEGYDFPATLLMPERLHAANRERPGAAPYRSPDDILAAVDREAPDVVFLFSAYLYAINGLFDVEAAARLIRGLAERGTPVVTSDPFLGLMARPDESTFAAGHPLRAAFADHFARLSPHLADLTHLYFMPADGIAVARRASVANPRATATAGAGPSKPRWLYILSMEDYAAQAAAMGRSAFDALLLDHLANAARLGRQPALIAPRPCVDALAGRSAEVEGLILSPFCGYDEFRALLLDAEYAFYWNIFSNSILARISNRRPVVFFGRGHMAHAIPRLGEVGIGHYYGDAPLPFLGPSVPPTAEALAALAVAQRAGFEGAIRRFLTSPDPEAMIAQILRESPGRSLP